MTASSDLGMLPLEFRLPRLRGATAWLNSDPLRPEDLAGKVVVVNFWTFTCINWIRTLPHVRGWAAAYRDDGLVVVGVHTPEFGVEHDVDRVRRAGQQMGVTYPVAIDNDYELWNAFANRYWPALYVADAQGRVRYHHFGEGGYERTEQVIRRLLVDAGHDDLSPDPAPIEVRPFETPADWPDLRSPETYLGLTRSSGFASPGGASPESRRYTVPGRLRTNEWALRGAWTIGREAAVLDERWGAITYRFHARDVNMILAPADEQGPVRFRVCVDGGPPGDAHGLDVRPDGTGTVDEARLFQLVRQPGRIDDRLFEIEFLDRGVGALCFTFG